MTSPETSRSNNRPTTSTTASIFKACFSQPLRLGSVQSTFVSLVGNEAPSSEERNSRSMEQQPRQRLPRRDTPQRADGLYIDRHQGVLWKRRDVFKNRWRPRWFVLQPGQGILTYYLLSGDAVVPDTVATESHTPRILSSTSSNNNVATNLTRAGVDPIVAGGGFTNSPAAPPSSTTPTTMTTTPIRDRTTSWDSRASENTLDYDVVPRGTIYLLGCTVQVNPALTRASEHLYAFTIFPPTSTETQIHLSARTPEIRQVWVERIAAVCNPTDSTHSSAATRDEGDVSENDVVSRSAPHSRNNNNAVLRSSIPEHEPVPSTPPRTALSTRTPSRANATTEPSFSFRESSSGSNTRNGEPSVTASSSTGLWKSLGQPTALYANLPDDLVNRIQDAMQLALELADQDPSSEQHQNDWKSLYDNQNGAVAYRRKNSGGSTLMPMFWSLPLSSSSSQPQTTPPPMIKMIATLKHPPRQVFELLVDCNRRNDYEDDIRSSRRIQGINPHTFYDYYAYNAIWPASPRDFAIVTHWQVLGKEESHGDKAIAIVSFSCPEAEQAVESCQDSASSTSALSTLASGPVRGQLHMSFNLIKRLATTGNGDQCQLIRILSFDLGGAAATSQLVNVVLNQRSNLPLHLSAYLSQHEPVQESRHAGPLTNELLIRDIIQKLDESRKVSEKRRQKGRQASPSSQSQHSIVVPDHVDPDEDDFDDKEFLLPPLDQQAILLFAPLVLYHLLVALEAPPSPAFWFVTSLFLVVRQLVLLHLGPTVSDSKPKLLGPITCRFRVDLKGVLRFIANKKEEREELQRGACDINVLHIVACAVSTALKKCDALLVKRVTIPFLGIDRLICRGSEPVSVTFLTDTRSESQFVTLPNVDAYNVQRVADEMKSAIEKSDGDENAVGTCLIIAGPNYDKVEMETDVLPMNPNVRVVCTIGGVHLDRNSATRSSAFGRPPSPRPFLSLSLTIANTSSVDFIACRRFAEDVQTLLQFPEMCDD